MQVVTKDVTKLNAGSFEWLPQYSKKEYIKIQHIHTTMIKEIANYRKCNLY